MINKELLKQRFHSRIRYTLFVCLIAFVVIGYSIYDIFFSGSDDLFLQITMGIFMAIAVFIFFFDLYLIVSTMIDIANLKKDKYEVIIAKFTRYQKKVADPKSPTKITYSGQVFYEKDTQKEFALDVFATEPNVYYKIAFGKHSKLGIPLEKIK